MPWSTDAHITVAQVNYHNVRDAHALVLLLDYYACDPMGGGSPLASEVKARLCNDLAQRPDASSFIA